MELREAARKYLEALGDYNRDRRTYHYHVNRTRAALQRAHYAEYKRTLWKKDAEEFARRMVGDE